jgi:preprotein translocase subunit YajC
MLNLPSFALAQVSATGSNPVLAFLPLIFMFVIFYFLLIRPQQKRQKELNQMLQDLKKGDKVVTSGGLIGTIAGIQNDYIILKVGEGETKVEVLKSAVSGKRN